MNKVAYIYPLVHPVNAKVSVPGSKSITNRALITAALANGVTSLYGASDSNDSRILVKLLQQLGVDIQQNNDTLFIKGNGVKFKSFNGELNAEDAGTVMRFLTALCCIIPGEIILNGSERMQHRPIHGLVEGLKQTGAKITYLGKDGFPPLKIIGGNIAGAPKKVFLDASMSSQFVSSMLMLAPVLPHDTELISNEKTASVPYIDMTISVMKHFGAVVINDEYKHYYIKGNQQYRSAEYWVEGDASSASYLLAIAAISGSNVEVVNLSSKSMQSDAAFADILGQIGCEIDMSGMPDTAQTLAVVAAFTKGETVITGLKTLRIKETDRLAALKNELTKMNIHCETGNDYIKIKGGSPKGALINTYNDHRMAMAFAVAGTKIPGMQIQNPDVVKKSFPGFWDILKEMGIKVEIK